MNSFLKKISIPFIALFAISTIYAAPSNWLKFKNTVGGPVVWKLASKGDLMCITTNEGIIFYDMNQRVILKRVSAQEISDSLKLTYAPTLYEMPGTFIDSKDHLWVGTSNGIIKFEGLTAKAYYTATDSVPNAVTAFCEDSSGVIWAGGGTGLSTFNGTTWTPAHGSGTLPAGVTAMVAQKNKLWIGTTSGLFTFTEGTFTLLSSPVPSVYPGYGVLDLTIDKDGNVWEAQTEGIAKYNGTTWTAFVKTQLGVASNASIRSIGSTPDGKIYAGTTGISVYNGTTWSLLNSTNSHFPSQKCNGFLTDYKERLWVATVDGLACLENNDWSVYSFEIPGGFNTLAIDNDNQVWVSAGLILAKYSRHDDKGIWQMYLPYQDGYTKSFITSLYVDPSNKLWAINDSGAGVMDGKKWKFYRKGQNGLGVNNSMTLNCVAVNKSGTTWIGASSGLYKLSDTTWANCYDTAATPQSYYESLNFSILTFDNSDNLWGFNGVLVKSSGNSWSFEDKVSAYPGTKAIGLSADGKIFIGSQSSNSGMSVWDGSSAKTLTGTNTPQLAKDGVSGFAEDKQQRMWFVQSSQIGYYNNGTVTSFTKDSVGATLTYLKTIIVDKGNRVWISGENLVAVYTADSMTVGIKTQIREVHQTKGISIVSGKNLATLRYSTISNGLVSCAVYNMSGQKVKQLFAENQSAGIKSFTFSKTDLLSGSYIVKVTEPSRTRSIPLTVIK